MTIECHGLDTVENVFFYEQDYYCLSNFSSFTLMWKGIRFDTLEHAYHWEKFVCPDRDKFPKMLPDIELKTIQDEIRFAKSAHEAYQMAQAYKYARRPDWDEKDENGTIVKIAIMLNLLIEKVKQHDYVKRKLLDTGTRVLIENSWRDDFWGWGPNKDGHNWLGGCWMLIRTLLQNGTIVI